VPVVRPTRHRPHPPTEALPGIPIEPAQTTPEPTAQPAEPDGPADIDDRGPPVGDHDDREPPGVRRDDEPDEPDIDHDLDLLLMRRRRKKHTFTPGVTAALIIGGLALLAGVAVIAATTKVNRTNEAAKGKADTKPDRKATPRPPSRPPEVKDDPPARQPRERSEDDDVMAASTLKVLGVVVGYLIFAALSVGWVIGDSVRRPPDRSSATAASALRGASSAWRSPAGSGWS
jgi:hypothetical protein